MKLPKFITRWLMWRMNKIRLNRGPDFIIGDHYLDRWWVIPRNYWFNIYFHIIRKSDDDRALHDHPWLNCSVLLRGGYLEVVTGKPPVRREEGSVVLRKPSTQHRLILENEGDVCWSLFITGPAVRTWGFQCLNGWKPWREFVDPDNTGKVGPGCGD